MKILGIAGSKRKKGNTSLLIEQAMEELKKNNMETEIIYLGDYNYSGCTGCEGCRNSYNCVIDDDMQIIHKKMLESDGLILGSPTYFYNVTGDVKTFIDRCYCFDFFHEKDRSVWMSMNELSGIKHAVVIAVCEQETEDNLGFTADAMTKFLQAIGYRVVDELKVLHAFKAGEVKNNEKALEEAQRAGQRLLKTLELKNLLQHKMKI